MKSLIYTMLKPYSAILFLQSRMIGFLLLLLTFINPSVALSGIVAIAFALLFAYLLGIKEDFLSQGFYIYNSLLVGMGVGYLYEPTLLSFSLVAIVSSLTFLLSFMINRLFSVYQIPILSLPFAIVTMFLYLASLKYSALLSSLVNNASMSDITLPLILSGFFKSLGTIFFLPNNIAGILMILLVLYVSRVVFIMALSGYYFGVLVHSFLLGSYEQALQDPYAFNYILVAIALGGVFLLPTIKGFFIAMIGVAMTIKGDRGDRERIFSIMSKIASQSVKKSDLKKIYEFTDKLHDVDYLEGRLTNEIKSIIHLSKSLFKKIKPFKLSPSSLLSTL